MLRSLRGAAVLGGLRGSAAVDLGAVADLIAAVSELWRITRRSPSWT